MKLMTQLTLLGLLGTLLSIPVWASGGHGHGGGHGEHEEEEKGPQGGRILEEGDFAVELTIFEQGVPAQMRVYAYDDHQPVAPEKVELEVELRRLGGVRDTLRFQPEGAYLLGDQTVREPHSFDVHVRARYQNKSYEWEYESHEGRTELSERFARESGVRTETVGPRTLQLREWLYGRIRSNAERVTHIRAPYPGEIAEMRVSVGDRVEKGDVLAQIKSRDSLETYALRAPLSGVVTERLHNPGEFTGSEPLLVVQDLSEVWVELLAYPEQSAGLAVGQTVRVQASESGAERTATIDYIAPHRLPGNQGTRLRASLNNEDDLWAPGQRITGEVFVEERQVPLAVRRSALQSFRNFTVVFARFGNTYEVRMLKLGERDEDYVEVLDGIAPGTEYVTENSYLIKADILKSGASHAH